MTMRPLDLIRKKRDGGELSSDEIQFLVRAYTHDEIPDYQMAAWLMAVLIRGMTCPELSALTGAMLYSGEVLDLSTIPGARLTSIRPAAWRQNVADHRPGRRRSWRHGSHDQRPGPRPHRRTSTSCNPFPASISICL
jgi:hypothetical protein